MDAALQSFQHFMDSGPGPLGYLAWWVIVLSVVAFVHELGHALAARRRVDGAVVVFVGANPPEHGFALEALRRL